MVTTKIWREWYKIWEVRNQVVHGHDQATKQTAKRATAIRELSIVYSRRLQLLPKDRDHLFPTLAEHASQSTHQIVNWLNTSFLFLSPFITGVLTSITTVDHLL